jgi:hypothetical protein
VIGLVVGAAVGAGATERPGPGPPAQDSGELGGKEASRSQALGGSMQICLPSVLKCTWSESQP